MEYTADPLTYSEAMQRGDWMKWQEAINSELQSMKDNEVWVYDDRPSKKVIDFKWLFEIKSENDNPEYKVRLGIRGFKDTNVYGLKNTYTPVAHIVNVRMIFAIINKYNLDSIQMFLARSRKIFIWNYRKDSIARKKDEKERSVSLIKPYMA